MRRPAVRSAPRAIIGIDYDYFGIQSVDAIVVAKGHTAREESRCPCCWCSSGNRCRTSTCRRWRTKAKRIRKIIRNAYHIRIVWTMWIYLCIDRRSHGTSKGWTVRLIFFVLLFYAFFHGLYSIIYGRFFANAIAIHSPIDWLID